MNGQIEVAAAEAMYEHGSCLGPEDVHVTFIAVVRAAYGCEQCGGARKIPGKNYMTDRIVPGEWHPCPAEHAVITVLGETIYADPERCITWCKKHDASWIAEINSCGIGVDFGQCDPEHQPRWSLIAGGE